MSDTNQHEIAKASVLFLFAESPVHAGASEGKAALDLPIQRSVQTQWPILNDSTMRGGLRSLCDDEKAKLWFGTEEGENPHPGQFSTPDAELLLFPVAAARGITAWVTCMRALEYFKRRLEMFEPSLSASARAAVAAFREALAAAGSGPGNPGEAWTADSSSVRWNPTTVILESDSFSVPAAKSAEKLGEWLKNAVPLPSPWPERVKSHFVLVHEDAFTHYALRRTDIRTRIKINEGRVAKTGPWTEENLPVDSVLHTTLAVPAEGNVAYLEAFRKQIGLSSKPVIQLGGDQTLGRGFLRLRELGA